MYTRIAVTTECLHLRPFQNVEILLQTRAHILVLVKPHFANRMTRVFSQGVRDNKSPQTPSIL